MSFTFVKGHGTRNDFVVLPDLDGTVHGDLEPELVQRLCDRRGGIGADGVLRVLRGTVDGGADWLMDYRNADGSVSQMCGNGIRVFARYLGAAGLVDTSARLAVDTRDGIKQVAFCDDGEISVDMGRPRVGADVEVVENGQRRAATAVDMGNPHAVAFVASVDEVGPLTVAPGFEAGCFPDGVNVEFVERCAARLLRMRVFERGAGETQSCGTGACASVAAVMAGAADGAAARMPYVVQVAGGRLTVTPDDAGHLHLKGAAVLVASGTWTA